MAATAPVRILPRSEHNISRTHIDPDALKVLYRLHRNGHMAYLVGGSVRDLLLGRVPKDYDIGTDARPEQILELFRNSRIIGRRFPIVHVLFGGGKVVEVATFRAGGGDEDVLTGGPDDDGNPDQAADLTAAEEPGMEGREGGFAESAAPHPGGGEDRPRQERDRWGRRLLRRQERSRRLVESLAAQHYGSPAEDAWRRDLTINGLFYDIADFSVIDYVGGLEDLEAGIIRSIGDPEERFVSDPVRMIRALRHAARIGFTIEAASWSAILRHREKIAQCNRARLLEEFYRDLRSGAAFASLRLMKKSGVLGVMLPELDLYLPDWDPEGGKPEPMAWRRLEILDARAAQGAGFSPAFLLAFLFAFPLLDFLADEERRLHPAKPDTGRLAFRFLKPMTSKLGVARRDTERLFLIAISQRRLARCRDGLPIPAFFRNKPYFDEAYELFALDSEARGAAAPDLAFSGRRSRQRSRRRSRR